jgi:Fe-S cluster assembly iron-binding protein IscA
LRKSKEDFMITITDFAAEKGKAILTAEGKPEWGLRVYLSGSSCCGPAFGMDLNEHPSEGEKGASEKLKGMEIHFMDDGEQQGFVIRGNQPSSCSPQEGSGCSSCG